MVCVVFENTLDNNIGVYIVRYFLLDKTKRWLRQSPLILLHQVVVENALVQTIGFITRIMFCWIQHAA